jgi:hypothetical protein
MLLVVSYGGFLADLRRGFAAHAQSSLCADLHRGFAA